MRAAAIVPILALSIAGCIAGEDAPASQDLPPVHDPPVDDEPWSLALAGCHEAGFVAAYNRDGLFLGGSHVPEPWRLADVREELGDPHVSALGEPMLGEVTGHWHMAFVCEDMDIGWVGVSVEAPEFDPGGADRHMLLSGLSFGDDDVRETIHHATGFEPTRNLRAEVTALGPAAFYTLNDDETKGVYEGWGAVRPLYEKDTMTVRWWMTLEEGKVQRPISFDVTYSGAGHSATGESAAPGCHTRTPMHGPQGGLCGPSVIVSYTSPDVTITFNGEAADTVKHAWHH